MTSILLVDGLDPSGGGGILAAARVVERYGLRPVGVVTALAEQTTSGLRAVNPVAGDIVGAQLTALLSDVEVAAVMVGGLGDVEVAGQVARALAQTSAPVVWNPALLPPAGRVAPYRGDPAALVGLFAPHLGLLSATVADAEILLGAPIGDAEAMRRAAGQLVSGPFAVLLRGAAPGRPAALLATRQATHDLGGDGAPDLHGGATAIAAALACNVASGLPLLEAARAALAFVELHRAVPVTAGRGPPSLF